MQMEYLEQITTLCRRLLTHNDAPDGADAELYKQTQGSLDRACLLFCISIVDHVLKGDLFESVVVGFLAVTGIDAGKGVFKQPSDYSLLLSGLIKTG